MFHSGNRYVLMLTRRDGRVFYRLVVVTALFARALDSFEILRDNDLLNDRAGKLAPRVPQTIRIPRSLRLLSTGQCETERADRQPRTLHGSLQTELIVVGSRPTMVLSFYKINCARNLECSCASMDLRQP